MEAVPRVASVSFLEDAEAYMGMSPSVDFVTGTSAILATTAKQSSARPTSAFSELSCSVTCVCRAAGSLCKLLPPDMAPATCGVTNGAWAACNRLLINGVTATERTELHPGGALPAFAFYIIF